jgi:hypothetical protein
MLAAAAAVLLPPALVGGPSHARASPGSLDFTLHLDARSAPLIAGKRIATFVQAVRFLGRPARIVPGKGESPACEATWPARGLAIDFSTGQSDSCASGTLGPWVDVEASDSRWHTLAGLHVTATERRLLMLYPHTRRLDFLGKGRLWELETGGPYCDGGRPLALAGQVRSAHVHALDVVHVPACG